MTVDEYIIHKSEWNKLHNIDEPMLTIDEARSILDYRKKKKEYSKAPMPGDNFKLVNSIINPPDPFDL